MDNVLVVSKTDLFRKFIDPAITDIIVPNPQTLFEREPSLLPRNACELDNGCLQVIPYITLFDKSNGNIFVYLAECGELHSIGIQDHITTHQDDKRSLINILTDEIVRILHTTVNIPTDIELRHNIHYKLVSDNCGVIYYRGEEISSRHIGVAMFIGVDSVDTKTIGLTTPLKGKWMSISTIEALIETGKYNLEYWSRMIIGLTKY